MRVRRYVWVGLLALLPAVGCQSPPAARPHGCGSGAPPKPALLAAQVARDTAVEAAVHPARSARAVVREPVEYARAWGVGVVEKRIALRLLSPPPPVEETRPPFDAAALEADTLRRTGTPPGPAEVALFTDGGDALAALERVIDSARCRVDVLMYLWGNDEVGWRVAKKLAAKAGPELPVRVLVDGGGNLTQGEPKKGTAADVNAAVCWLAEQPHVTLVRTRNPAARFDHRKLVVADGRVAWSGGRNFLAAAFTREHDLSYTLAGPLAVEMAARFEEFWRDQGGTPASPLPEPTPPAAANAAARLVATGPAERSLARAVYDAVSRAERHVYVENPYFSDTHLIYLLAKARQRGADVRAVLTLDSNSGLFDRANRVTANRLLRAGVRVYVRPGTTHVKAVAVDGVWAYTGTGNFDPLSLRHNRELGLTVVDGPLIGEMEEKVFRPDFRPEWELTAPLPLAPLDRLYELLAAGVA